jgi:uncharacterized protein YndB with AHSA1/START domain
MADHSVTHATFTLERSYPSSPHRVFEAWANPAIKARWFAGGSPGYQLDFRAGGIERNTGTHDGKQISWESLYREIVTDQRIVYTSVLCEQDVVATVSLTTVELVAGTDTDPAGTRLVLVEAGAYLDGREHPEWREQGTSDWLDSLGRHLAEGGVA